MYVCVCVCACKHNFLHSHTFFFVTDRYSCPELRSRLRFVFCQLSTFRFRFLVGVEPVLGPHSQPRGSTVDDEEVPGLSLSVAMDLDALWPALDAGPALDGPALDGSGLGGPGLMPVAIF